MLGWFSAYHTLVSCLVNHAENLSSCLRDFMELGSRDDCICLQYSRILTLTAISGLYNILAGLPLPLHAPPSPDFDAKCREAVNEIIMTTETLCPTDFSVLDPLLGVNPLLPALPAVNC